MNWTPFSSPNYSKHIKKTFYFILPAYLFITVKTVNVAFSSQNARRAEQCKYWTTSLQWVLVSSGDLLIKRKYKITPTLSLNPWVRGAASRRKKPPQPTSPSDWPNLLSSLEHYTPVVTVSSVIEGFYRKEQKSSLLSSSFLTEPKHILHIFDNCRAAALFCFIDD